MITGRILKQNGWPEGKLIGFAKAAASTMERNGLSRSEILTRLDEVRAQPDEFTTDPVFGPLAAECRRQAQRTPADQEVLRTLPLEYGIWGAEQIDASARAQMDAAMRLPVSVAGALMPDAHSGYGLPIGGVLATAETVIPYAVGVDIAYRMRLSIYPVASDVLQERPDTFEQGLMRRTRFGAGGIWDGREQAEHEVVDEDTWHATRLLKSLRNKARQQLGTSGSGNHFVEWGAFTLIEPDERLGLAPGEYLALLSHSGSRGVGYAIANHYSKLAEQLHPTLNAATRHLAWLSLDTEAGQEYWQAMELAGRFASANHWVIHHRVAAAAGLKEVAAVENHHNFAWHETVLEPDGTVHEAIVHRKGATPAGAGVLGVIPGSMGDTGYLVRGRGEPHALNSTSHGAGRAMSRRSALESLTKADRDGYLQAHGVTTLLGGGLDEAPQAYKRMETVIAAQDDLVEIIGGFAPRIVRIADG